MTRPRLLSDPAPARPPRGGAVPQHRTTARTGSWRRRAAGLACSALLAFAAAASGADDAALAQLREALDRAFAAAETDHGKVRDGKLAEMPATVREAVRDAWAGERTRRTKPEADPGTDGFATALAATGLAVSRPTVAVLACELAATDPPAAEGVAEAIRSALARIFAEPRFEDTWDRAFGVLPEVRAWREAHEKAAAPAPDPETPPAPGPGPETPDPPPGTGPATPTVPPVPPDTTAPARPDDVPLPPPLSADRAANLVPLDKSRVWVGPWTGWTQELADKDNRRQKRPAKAVWIDRYEVTCTEYLEFLAGLDVPKRRAMLPVGWSLDAAQAPAFPAGRAKAPVTGVSFAQAEAYAASVGKRLPTEDEWDRAAGGGEREGRAFPWGDADPARTFTWGGDSATGPADVDASPADRTPDGVVGLAGNVAELVATLADRRDAPARPGPDAEIVIRGGSWKTSRVPDCAATFRWVLAAAQGAPHVGFRCVMDEAEFRRRYR